MISGTLLTNFSFFLQAVGDYQYLQNAIIAGTLVGILCGVIGCFIILRRLSLMGDAISHAVLPGVVISYMLGITFFIGAVITGVATALGIGYVSQNSKLKDDSSIGILFTAAFALGIVMITALDGTEVDLWHILFGNVLAVSRSDLLLTASTGIVSLIGIFIYYRELVISTFDPIMARAIGIATDKLHYLLMLLLSLVTVASLQTVGIVLVVAMLITPAATAFLLTRNLARMLILSAIIGVISSLAGVYFSFIYDVATGGAIVLAVSVLFLAAFLFSPREGIIIKRVKYS
ncbi:metal ABC transporter permease [Natranaerobius thermophilus]|uniref:ABC-3 protein n=1 Tax=Natranaerobius thermophilus (strain ATCC BAA-1301 / DSM 18059 / JW/NM-WN-LF) TaxID=457570 RepID=B2A2Y5_NATTJ|nr:metal ABC transporter permease [Natranaerobius thermophilus]ACB86352.1 ABC-3 protein [Natranaerobius thermophilus JW/NM-WN-LF]